MILVPVRLGHTTLWHGWAAIGHRGVVGIVELLASVARSSPVHSTMMAARDGVTGHVPERRKRGRRR